MISLANPAFHPFVLSPDARRQAAEIGRFLHFARTRRSLADCDWMRRVVSLETIGHHFSNWDPNRSEIMAQASPRAISDEDCLRIRESDEPDRVWAERLGVARTTVVNARLGHTHRHLPGAQRPHSKRGVFNRKAKLDEARVREIILSKRSKRETARRYGVTTNTVGNIWAGLSWVDVSREGAPRRRLAAIAKPKRGTPHKLSDDAVRDIVTSPLAATAMAAKYGYSVSGIQWIRAGKTYRHVSRKGALTNADRRRLRKTKEAVAA